MALGVCRVVGSDVGVATTGVAGPEPQDGQAVGTVFVAVAVEGAVEVSQLRLDGTRSEIRAATVAKALALLLEQLAAVEDRGAPGR
jgi:nicotinamide-nucleotide amidase